MKRNPSLLLLLTLAILLILGGGYFMLSRKLTSTRSANNVNLLSAPVAGYVVGEKPFIQLNIDYTCDKTYNFYRSADNTNWIKLWTVNFKTFSRGPGGPNGEETFGCSGGGQVDYNLPQNEPKLYYKYALVGDNGQEIEQSEVVSVDIPNVTSSVNSSTWKTYTNTKYGFSFTYPDNYKLIMDETSVEDYSAYVIKLIDSNTDAYIEANIVRRKFDLSYIQENNAPTGLSDIPPTKKMFGTNEFYYYGAGGGGVYYADRYFYNLNGTLLTFSFAGPFSGTEKTPSAETKKMESQLLSTFRFTPPPPQSSVLTKELALQALEGKIFDTVCSSSRINGKYASCLVEMVKTGDNWTVTVTYNGLYDDSVSAARYTAVLSYKNGRWTAGTVTQTQQCAVGRGHQDFSYANCL